MKQRTNSFYYRLPRAVKEHLLSELHLGAEDQKILLSVMNHDADTNFHYENTQLPKEKFDRHFLTVNDIVLWEIVRLASVGIKTEKSPGFHAETAR